MTPSRKLLEKADIAKLFALFQARYGHKWVSTLGDDEQIRLAVNVWMKDLNDDCIPPAWIERGFERWREDWPPSSVEFSRACLPTPEEMGLPGYEHAYDDAMSALLYAKTVHPTVHNALDMIGRYKFGRMSSKEARNSFMAAYKKIVSERQYKKIVSERKKHTDQRELDKDGGTNTSKRIIKEENNNAINV